MKIVATYSIKGGVGKTTAAVNLAAEATRTGARVLVWDLDPQGAATFYFRVKPAVRGGVQRLVDKKQDLHDHVRETDHPGLHLLPADFSLRHLDLRLDETKQPTRRLATLLRPLADRYDVTFLDCAPGITLTSETVFGAVDALLVPTIPTPLAIRTLDQLTAFLRGQEDAPKLLPFASMVDRRKRIQRELLEELVQQYPQFLPTVIPNASVVEQMGVRRAPLCAFAPSSPAAEAFRQLWSDIAAKLWA